MDKTAGIDAVNRGEILENLPKRREAAKKIPDRHEAISTLRRILKEASDARLESHCDVVLIREDIAEIFFTNELYFQAIKECSIAWEIRVRNCEPGDAEELTTRLNLVRYLTAAEEYQKAEKVVFAGIKDMSRVSINPVRISALEPLAKALLLQRQYEKALELFQIVLRHGITSHGKMNAATVGPRWGVAAALFGLDRFSEARARALDNVSLLENVKHHHDNRIAQHQEFIKNCDLSTAKQGQFSETEATEPIKKLALSTFDGGSGVEAIEATSLKDSPGMLTDVKGPVLPVLKSTQIPVATTSTKAGSGGPSYQSTNPNYSQTRSRRFSNYLTPPSSENPSKLSGYQALKDDKTSQDGVKASKQTERWEKPWRSTQNSMSTSARPAGVSQAQSRSQSPTFIPVPLRVGRTSSGSKELSATAGAQVLSQDPKNISQKGEISTQSLKSIAKSREDIRPDAHWLDPTLSASGFPKDLVEIYAPEQSVTERRQMNELLLRDLGEAQDQVSHNSVSKDILDGQMSKSDYHPVATHEIQMDDDQLSTSSLPAPNFADRFPGIALKAFENAMSVAKSKWLLWETKGEKREADFTTFSRPEPHLFTANPSASRESSKLHPTAGHSSAASQLTPSSSYSGLPTGGREQGAWLDATVFTKDNEVSQAADQWLYDVKGAQELVEQAAHTNQKPIKICILDTGFDGRHPFLVDAPWGEKDAGQRVKGCVWFDEKGHMRKEKEWSIWNQGDRSSGYLDTNGHGTHCTGLLLQVAPKAHIYVARVIGGPDQKPNAEYVAQAIRHATEADGWGVDIISMSLGFEKQKPEEIARAINELPGNVLVFAAAANHSARYPFLAFPASMSRTICVKSANGDAKPSEHNPTNTTDAGKNFSALGEGVLSMWPVKDEWNNLRILQKRQSGTSVATPIAAACAALVLDFIRQADGREKHLALSRRVLDFGMKDGIERIFEDLMTEKKGGCRFLVPFKLLKTDPNSQVDNRNEAASSIYACLNRH